MQPDSPVIIGISRIHFPITVLGPGRRIGIWFQGCSIRCPGCISADTWATARRLSTVSNVMDAIAPWLAIADGVTISGGEPFDQPKALETLLREVRCATQGDILVFSGHPIEALRDHLVRMQGLIDAIVTDPFERASAQTLRLRGSDNQRLTFLTPLGKRRFQPYQEFRDDGDRALDVCFDDNGAVWFAGIPESGDFARLSALLEAQGHRIATSEDKSCQ